jgi:hypothetical protein
MYEKAFVEVLEVIDHMESNMTKQIPAEVIKAIMSNADKDYKYAYDESKGLSEQKISEDAQVILSVLFVKYIANDKEKSEIENLITENEKKLYDVFKKPEPKKSIQAEEIKVEELNEEKIIEEINESVQLVKKSDKWYTKIIDFIKNIFSKK